MTRALLFLAALMAAPACATDDAAWLLRQGVGQAELLFAARPISRVLADPETPAVIRRRLRLVDAARKFARDELGLDVQQQYRAVAFLDAPAVVYVLSAAPRTSLVPYEWEYPLLGALPYRGFFSLEEAEEEALRMQRAGFDVAVRPVPTYSLLGFLPDPVVSPMLFAAEEAWLVETVIHELAHATVFAPGQGAFNEGLATFIGREGRRRFVERHYGTDSAIYSWMERLDADREAYSRAVSALAFDLRVLFAQARGLPDEEVLRRKDAIFLRHESHFQQEVALAMATYRQRRGRLPDNNAELMSYGIYTLSQHLYRRAYAACNEDMRCLVRVLKKVARADDPETALAEHLKRERPRERVIR